jgi:hypothetical protein
MDFVDWLQVVLGKVVELSRTFPQVGVNDQQVAEALLGNSFVGNEAYFYSNQRQAAYAALEELVSLGLAEEKRKGQAIWVMPRQGGRDHIFDPLPFWHAICPTRLDEKQQAALRYFNNHSQKIESNFSLLQKVDSETLPSIYENDENKRIIFAVAKELQGIGFLKIIGESANARFTFRSTYKGLVWEHRRAFTLESRFIDQLVQEWETTSVDFKRELYLDNENQKAEFIKDILSLANTQASGRRWMIIGFDDKTRCFHTPPDPKLSQNRLEQLLAHYTSPVVDIRYEVVGYRSGQVGKIEVLRDAKKLPYKVAASVGNKKSISVGQMFVRHGSQVEEPTDLERDSITTEGERARKVG